METGANIGDLSAVSFPDFETKNRDDNASFENFGQCQPKHDIAMTLDLSLGQKSENLFATDQTPTPTRLIKNCDEVGLFEDLQHVNPFDIGFQRAAEQNAVGGGHTMPVTPTRTEAPTTDGDSLHTPQVYPLDSASLSAPAPAVSNSSSPLDVPVPNVEDLLNTPTAEPETSAAPSVASVADTGPPPLQLIQPQVITWVLPAQAVPLPTVPNKINKRSTNAPPTQKVRPLILPKPSTTSSPKTPSGSPVVPSSASLTPTSQLPIKERLKAMQSKNLHKKPRSVEPPASKSALSPTEDIRMRRRDAASRYRNKMRKEHKELKDHNVQLQLENKKLRQRIATLERELQQQRNNNNNVAGGENVLMEILKLILINICSLFLFAVIANQLQIPPSSIHLVINVPKLTVPSNESGLRGNQM